MSIVSNTGPLIALAKIDHLAILQRLFGAVYIPPAVHRELLAKSGPEAECIDRALSAFIEIKEVAEGSPAVVLATRGLDAGERDAVTLASVLGLPVIIDDRRGREAARSAEVPVTGLVGVLIHARDEALIPFASR